MLSLRSANQFYKCSWVGKATELFQSKTVEALGQNCALLMSRQVCIWSIQYWCLACVTSKYAHHWMMSAPGLCWHNYKQTVVSVSLSGLRQNRLQLVNALSMPNCAKINVCMMVNC